MTHHNTTRSIDTNAERDYWRGQYDKETYFEAGRSYDDYEGAYRAGYESRGQYHDKKFDDVEDNVRSAWEKTKGESRLAWDKARHAARAAWDRVERAMPGDADGDGR